MTNPMRAIVYLENTEADVEHLKRLALMFDEIHFIRPEMTVITEELLRDPERSRKDSEGRLEIFDFNYFRDTSREYSLQSLRDDLQETLSVLTEHGIAQDASDWEMKESPDNIKILKDIRDLMISLDVQDEDFNMLSETTKEDYDLSSRTLVVQMRDEDGKEFTIYAITSPNAVSDSYELTTSLFMSDRYSSFPVLTNPRHRREMEYRYTQYKKGLKALEKLAAKQVISPGDLRVYFGDVVFQVANTVFSPDLLSGKSIVEIVTYRQAMDGARRQYLASDLMELAALVKEDPWSPRLKHETENYVLGKLNSDLIKHENRSKEVWEKIFGAIPVHLAEISRSTALGGTTGGMLGHVIPNTSTWGMVLLGALAGVATEVPKVAKNLTDAVLEVRKERRSSIAYIANFRHS
jgi:hypothetical protein